MRHTAGHARSRSVLVLLALGLTACSGGEPHTLVEAGQASESVTEPAPTTTTASTTTSTTTTTPSVPVTAAPTPAVASAAPSPKPDYPNPPLESGVVPNGYGGYGGTRTVASGTTTAALSLYPREAYAGEMTQVGVEVGFIGGIRSIQIDFGDGVVVDGVYSSNWACNGDPGNKTTSAGGGHHFYAQPGTYTVRAIVTAFNCPPGGASEMPAWMVHPTLADGTINPDFLALPPVGPEYVTIATITAVSRPDRVPIPPPTTPPANCPPQAGGC